MGDGAAEPWVLFVCTGNTCRSPLAAAAAEALGVAARSAGTEAAPGTPATPSAASAATRVGLDLSSHRSRSLTRDDVAAAQLVLTMTAAQVAHIVDRWPRAAAKVARLEPGVDIEDPYGADQEVYDATAAQIVAAIEARFGRRYPT